MNSTPDAPELPPLPARWSIERIYAGPAQGYLVSGPDGSASVWPTDRNPKLILFKLAEALAARQAEPVAWFYHDRDLDEWQHVADNAEDAARVQKACGRTQPLYAATPAQATADAPLTDAKLLAVIEKWLAAGGMNQTRWDIKLCRAAIDAAMFPPTDSSEKQVNVAAQGTAPKGQAVGLTPVAATPTQPDGRSEP